MKRLLFAAVITAFAIPAFAQVGVSVNIGEPGFYGQIDIGGAPPPQVIYPQPVLVQPGVVGVAPIYLRVPPGYARHWRRYCGMYNACGRPVFFVRNDWYTHQYAPYYRAHYRGGPGPGYDHRGDGRGPDRGHDRDHDRHDH